MKLLPALPQPERARLARFALTFATIVVGWAICHDLYLIHVEPRHFTEYHRPLLPIADLRLLALQYALVATLGPGLVFGALAYAACRGGATKLGLPRVAAGFALVIVFAECVILALGRFPSAVFKPAASRSIPNRSTPISRQASFTARA